MHDRRDPGHQGTASEGSVEMRSMPFALYPLLRAGADGIVAEMVLAGGGSRRGAEVNESDWEP